jgi:hypothetical protein
LNAKIYLFIIFQILECRSLFCGIFDCETCYFPHFEAIIMSVAVDFVLYQLRHLSVKGSALGEYASQALKGSAAAQPKGCSAPFVPVTQ